MKNKKKNIVKKITFLIFIVIAVAATGALFPTKADALPFFARQIGRDCTFCHVAFPKLNERGRIFRSNGYRFAEDAEWKEVRDWTTIPVSMEVEVEGVYNNVKAAGVETTSSDMKVEEVEISMGGSMGKTGNVSALGMVDVMEKNIGEYEVGIHNAFVQINDLAGPTGSGMLNLKAGVWEIALPFLSSWQGIVKNRYFAEKTLGVFTPEQTAVELNGSIAATEESAVPTHRYNFGLTRENINNDDRLKGYYASYSMTFMERYNLGLIYRYGGEKNGTQDVNVNKFGVAGEIEIAPLIFTAGYFDSDSDSGIDLKNYLAEVLYMPLPKVILGARYDIVKEKGKEEAKAATVTARYNILSNVFALLEYRKLEDDSHVTGDYEDEDKMRLYLVALF